MFSSFARWHCVLHLVHYEQQKNKLAPGKFFGLETSKSWSTKPKFLMLHQVFRRTLRGHLHPIRQSVFLLHKARKSSALLNTATEFMLPSKLQFRNLISQNPASQIQLVEQTMYPIQLWRVSKKLFGQEDSFTTNSNQRGSYAVRSKAVQVTFEIVQQSSVSTRISRIK